MFSVADRENLRARLVETARHYPEIVTAALLGSAARGEEDRWSDIDLALGLAPGVDPVHAAETWTTVVEQTDPVVDYLDINASGGLYRVPLLASTLQVDLSFWPHGHFPTGGSPVQVLFGQTDPPPVSAEPEHDLSAHVRMSWLYALHLRSAVGVDGSGKRCDELTVIALPHNSLHSGTDPKDAVHHTRRMVDDIKIGAK